MAEAKKKQQNQYVVQYGKFCWNELTITSLNPDAAKKFYKGVFGWEAKAVPHSAMPYTQFYHKDEVIAGLFDATKMAPECPSMWLGYIHSKKLETTIKSITKHGGKLIKGPVDLPKMGRFAVMADPQGAGFALWQMDPETAKPPTKDGDTSVKKPDNPFCWHELHTPDEEEALKFYKPALGWTTHMHHDYKMISLKNDDVKKCWGGIQKIEGDSTAGWLPYIGVENADATIVKVTKHGGKVLKPAMDIPHVGRIAELTDPHGARFAIIQPDPETMPKPEGDEKKGKKASAKGKANGKGRKRKAEVEAEQEQEEASEGEGEESEDKESSSESEAEAEMESEEESEPEQKPKKGKGKAKAKAKAKKAAPKKAKAASKKGRGKKSKTSA